MAGLDRNFRVVFLALVRHVASDGTCLFYTVLAFLPFAAAGRGASGGNIALRLFVHPAFRSMRFLLIRNEEPLRLV